MGAELLCWDLLWKHGLPTPSVPETFEIPEHRLSSGRYSRVHLLSLVFLSNREVNLTLQMRIESWPWMIHVSPAMSVSDRAQRYQKNLMGDVLAPLSIHSLSALRLEFRKIR